MADKIKTTKAEEPEEDVKFITVHSTLTAKPDGGNPVALYERHPSHPGGEAYVAGDKPVKVAVTPEVSRLLRDGILVETT